MRYLAVVKNLLLAMSQNNRHEVRDFAIELTNLVADRVAINDIESEIAEELADEITYCQKENHEI
jgi:hypothetical protein